jgi:hypothetical protein
MKSRLVGTTESFPICSVNRLGGGATDWLHPIRIILHLLRWVISTVVTRILAIKGSHRYHRRPLKARWQSGYAADCKSVDIGSIPVRASTYTFIKVTCPTSPAVLKRAFKFALPFLGPHAKSR